MTDGIAVRYEYATIMHRSFASFRMTGISQVIQNDAKDLYFMRYFQR